MHYALEISEILLNIFAHCYEFECDSSNLSALARTCRAFKQPALDVLWTELKDLTPLARCLPEASYRASCENYSFHRSLTQLEWGVLQSYARRIRYIHLKYSRVLGQKFLDVLLEPPTTEPFFPNLRSLGFECPYEVEFLSFIPSPEHTLPDVDSHDIPSFENSLKVFSKMSPALTRLFIPMDHKAGMEMRSIDPSFICRWQNLRIVDFDYISMDSTTLVHLSRMPALTLLSFWVQRTLPLPLDTPLVFRILNQLTLYSESLGPISRLLSQTRLPAVTDVSTIVTDCSPEELPSLLASIQTSGSPKTVQRLSLSKMDISGATHFPGRRPVVNYQHLQPCTAFAHLRHVRIDMEWQVNLTEDQLLMLGSAWPRLEHFLINELWGWNTRGHGITPNGLVQLLQLCPSLARIALAIDTRKFTDVPSSLTLGSCLSYVDVVDSCIGEESVLAMAAFFSGLFSTSRSGSGVPLFILGDGCTSLNHTWGVGGHWGRWDDVRSRVRKVLGRGC